MGGHFPLEGDGCVPGLYHFLWSRNEHGRSCPMVFLPDTVVYKYRQPAYWYFTSREQTGQIKMKNKANLGNAKVEECFSARRDGALCEAVGYYVASSTSSADKQTNNGGRGQHTTLEHFDNEGLRTFLYFRDKENNGILQKYIEPKGNNNATIRAIWSPSVFLSERRTNICSMNDRKTDLARRIVTYEGPHHLSDVIGITETGVGQHIRRVCESIVRHVMHVSQNAFRIGRMVLHMRVDKNDRLWLLWCSSLRLQSTDIVREPSAPMGLENEISVPEHVKKLLKPSRDHILPEKERKRVVQCPMCQTSVPPDRRCECTYKMLIDFIEERHMRSAQMAEALEDWDTLSVLSEEEQDVPDVLRRLHPNLTLDNYMVLRKDPLFLYSRMTMCDKCFLVVTEVTYPSLPVIDPAAAVAQGLVHQRPSTVEPLDLSAIATVASSRPGSRMTDLSKPMQKRPRRKHKPENAPGDVPRSSSSMSMSQGKKRLSSKFGNYGRSKSSMSGSLTMAGDQSTYSGSMAPFRSTRLAENYVIAVSSQKEIKSLEEKLAKRPLPLPQLPSSAVTMSVPHDDTPEDLSGALAAAAAEKTDADIAAEAAMQGIESTAEEMLQQGLEAADDPSQSAFALSVLRAEERAFRAASASPGPGLVFKSSSSAAASMPAALPASPSRLGLNFAQEYAPGKARAYKSPEKIKRKPGKAKSPAGVKKEESETSGPETTNSAQDAHADGAAPSDAASNDNADTEKEQDSSESAGGVVEQQSKDEENEQPSSESSGGAPAQQSDDVDKKVPAMEDEPGKPADKASEPEVQDQPQGPSEPEETTTEMSETAPTDGGDKVKEGAEDIKGDEASAPAEASA